MRFLGASAATVLGLMLLPVTALRAQQPAAPRYLTTGIFIASIEEGARIFTLARLLPFGHPEALTHQFPTVLQLHGGEDQVLLVIGLAAGLRLLPGLRAIAVVDRSVDSFIVDTRGLSLADRHMQQATTMGLDLSCAGFVAALDRAALAAPAVGAAIIVFTR